MARTPQPITHDLIDEVFSLKLPTPEQAARLDWLNADIRELGHDVLDRTHPGPGQTLAIRKLAELRSAVVSAVLFDGAW